MHSDNPFETHTLRYEQWFENNKYVYLSELKAVRSFIPNHEKGIEIGVGSGRFAAPLGISVGIEPSLNMRLLAVQRGIFALAGTAENLPFQFASFGFALMVTTLCFVDNIITALEEIHRVLLPDGKIIIGFVDRESPLGQLYLRKKEGSVFYRNAVFYSVPEVAEFLKDTGFYNLQFMQTVFNSIKQIKAIEPVLKGFGKGSFVVVCAEKRSVPTQ